MPRQATPSLRQQYVTLPQAARKLGVHYYTLYAWARSGKLPVFRISPKLFLVDWVAVVAMVERSRVPPAELPRRSAGDLARATAGPRPRQPRPNPKRKDTHHE